MNMEEIELSKKRHRKYLKLTILYFLVMAAFSLIGGKEIRYYTVNSVPVGENLYGKYYWLWAVLFWAAVTAYILISFKWEKQGKQTIGLYLKTVWHRYRFLIEQLVGRDFKSKYKRSVLGYLWSFLNPLLTSLVQYVVFSTIFKSSIPNFPAYLITGVIFFGFFSDAVTQGLQAIVANAPLITKVYVPKWIYPVTKVGASSTNFIISLIPLFIVAFITGCRPSFALLLLVFDIVCLLVYCIGLSLILTTMNVFFRDTQYLWGIAITVISYATPLFYPESIIPGNFQWVIRLNPLYHYIKFARTCIIDGVSPTIMRYWYCFISAVVMLAIGCLIFKKNQDKFALYI